MYSPNPKGLSYYTTDDEEEEEDEDEYYDRMYRGRYSYSPKPKVEVQKDKFKPKRNVFDMQLQRFELFKAQDVKTGHFDVIFEVDGKRIFANKFILSSSEPLTSMLSDRWCDKDAEAVKIEAYSYDNFYQFLCFLYSGQCHLSQENAVVLTDMSEFYGIATLKGFCDEWLSKRKEDINEKNVYEFIEIAHRYSLKEFLGTLERLYIRNLDVFLGDDLFLNVKKDIIELLLSLFSKNQEEEFFEAIYKWAEHQAIAKQVSEDGDVVASANDNLQEAIKAELTGILSHFDFRKMRLDFFVRFIDEGKGFIFSAPELYKILLSLKRSPNQEEAFFKALYQLAEKEALKKQEKSGEEIFDLSATIKAELAPFLSQVKFHQMSEKFLIEFFYEDKDFLFSAAELYKILLSLKRSPNQEEAFFKTLYQLAEKEALKKQEKSDEEIFDLSGAIKAELAPFLPQIKFYEMSEKFLIEFVVQVRNADKILTGTFKDNFNMFDRVQNGNAKVLHRAKTVQKFSKLKCKIPTTPSIVHKMKGAEWYLCLNTDGTVAVKFHKMIATTDYLIAELKSPNSDFNITLGIHTFLTVTRKKMF
uniref:BTB domain-containing protein n=1 Tax=Panagrolaimus sp. PS1159 TaxID=55785 RepID=A0AC35GSP4_9BILA